MLQRTRMLGNSRTKPRDSACMQRLETLREGKSLLSAERKRGRRGGRGKAKMGCNGRQRKGRRKEKRKGNRKIVASRGEVSKEKGNG